jgi:hypothetical protein
VKKANLSLGRVVAGILVMAGVGAITTTTIILTLAYAVVNPDSDTSRHNIPNHVPIATSDNNVYVTWWTNKSGDSEVMFKASNDGGKTFGSKINLSNSPGIRSDNAEIAASGNNVYVSWWERTDKSDEPVMRVSNDNGKTFGEDNAVK